MSEMIANLGQLLGGWGNFGKIASTVGTGVGEAGNIMSMIQRGQQADYLKKIENLSPQQLSAKVNAATQPLNASLVQAVTNPVQASLAERGLAESPGIFAADLSQALAPYQQQNQNTAYNLLMSQWGLPGMTAGILTPPMSMSPSMANLYSLWSKSPSFNQYTNTTGPVSPYPNPSLVDSPVDYGGLTPAGANA